MTALTEFLFPAPAPRREGEIYLWWERRRLGYNAIVGATGLFSLAVIRIMTLLPPDPHPMMPLALPLAFGIGANVFYFLGPITEIAIFRLWGRKTLPTGPVLFRMGLTFSVGLAFMPTFIAFLDYGVRLLKWLL